MLIRVAVQNYRSFKEHQVFSMVAGKESRHSDHVMRLGGKRLLKSSFFFGANASGKSNFVHAIDLMTRLVLHGVREIKYQDREFKIDPNCRQEPGVFQIDFTTNGKTYSYGFAVDYRTNEFVEEWLYRIESQESEVCIFERHQGEQIDSDLLCNVPQETVLRFKIYTEDLKADELLLSVIGRKAINKRYGFSDYLDAYRWFRKIQVIYPSSVSRNKIDFLLDTSARSFDIATLLASFDTGIESVRRNKRPAEEVFSDELVKDWFNDIQQMFGEDLKQGERYKFDCRGEQINLFMENGELMAETVQFNHGNDNEMFDIGDESDGTRRLLDLLPVYDLSKKEKIVIIDELDRSFHPALTKKYIEGFFEMTAGQNAQPICTTHDTTVLDMQLLRQDEIWFVERQADHSSHIYSLSNFKERIDKNILNDYLLGRYGAIPCFTDSNYTEDNQ